MASITAKSHSVHSMILICNQCSTVPPKRLSWRGGPLCRRGRPAALAGCHTVTVWRAVRAGELRALRLGGRGDYRIPVDALEEWLRPAHDPDENRR